MNGLERAFGRIATTVRHPVGATAVEVERLRRLQSTAAGVVLVSGRRAQGVGVRSGTVPVCGADLPIRIYRTVGADPQLPMVINFHGGGFVLGSTRQTEWLCSRLARALPAVVVSVDYRLAPEHPSPGPSRDCNDATRWLIEHANGLGADPRRVLLTGDSAGGTLAALVARAHTDAGDLPPLAGQVLAYAPTDLTLGSASIDRFATGPVITRSMIDWFGNHYLPAGTDAADPIVSPLFADPVGMPPTLVLVAGQDPFRDDGIRYALALRSAGVDAQLIIFADTVHGFLSLPGISPAAHKALGAICGFAARRLLPANGVR